MRGLALVWVPAWWAGASVALWTGGSWLVGSAGRAQNSLARTREFEPATGQNCGFACNSTYPKFSGQKF